MPADTYDPPLAVVLLQAKRLLATSDERPLTALESHTAVQLLAPLVAAIEAVVVVSARAQECP